MPSPDADTIEVSTIEVSTADRLFFSYGSNTGYRPAITALFAPDGTRLTRDIGAVPEGSDDHPHHKGVWWGAVIGEADIWTENQTSGSITSAGRPHLQELADGSVRLEHEQDWLVADGSRLLHDQRLLHAFPAAPDGSRILDITSCMTPVADPVTFIDTKEAGLISVRVLPSMEGRRGGRITLSTGATGEEQSWGRSTIWCDYSGPTVPGGGPESWAGITVFDHPANPRPAYWHVRDYGLLTANPFGLATFTDDPDADGSMTLTPGVETVFRYRLLTHPGDHRAVDLQACHQAYADQ